MKQTLLPNLLLMCTYKKQLVWKLNMCSLILNVEAPTFTPFIVRTWRSHDDIVGNSFLEFPHHQMATFNWLFAMAFILQK